MSQREIETLRGVARGMPNAVIARHMFVTEDTVKSHLRSVFQKLGAHDRAHAVALGYRHGYLDVSFEPPLPQAATPDQVAELMMPPPRPKPPKPAESEACQRCAAVIAVLADGQGDKGLSRRIVNAIRAVKEQEELKEWRKWNGSESDEN